MPRRKDRLPVVFDTNVIVGYLLRRRLKSATSRIFDLWYKQHHLDLIVSDEVIAEYHELWNISAQINHAPNSFGTCCNALP